MYYCSSQLVSIAWNLCVKTVGIRRAYAHFCRSLAHSISTSTSCCRHLVYSEDCITRPPLFILAVFLVLWCKNPCEYKLFWAARLPDGTTHISIQFRRVDVIDCRESWMTRKTQKSHRSKSAKANSAPIHKPLVTKFTTPCPHHAWGQCGEHRCSPPYPHHAWGQCGEHR